MEGIVKETYENTKTKKHVVSVEKSTCKSRSFSAKISLDDVNTINLLLERSACSLKLKKYDDVINDCKQILDIEPKFVDPRVYGRLIFSLFQKHKFNEAKKISDKWISADPDNLTAIKTSKKIPLLFMVEKKAENVIDMLEITENDEIIIKEKLFYGNIENQEYKEEEMKDQHSCIHCNMNFDNSEMLTEHYLSETHIVKVASCDEYQWKYRNPPRGFFTDQYKMCPSILNMEPCRLGEQCVDAHSIDELNEWKERFEYRREKIKETKSNSFLEDNSSYAEKLLDNFMNAKIPSKVMKESLEEVDVEIEPSNLSVTLPSKNSHTEWSFTISSDCRRLNRVVLLHDDHRNHYHISSILPCTTDLINSQEWVNDDAKIEENSINKVTFTIKVKFSSDIFGTFRQTIVFDFGDEPVLIKKLCVDVVPKSQFKIIENAKQSLYCTSERWDIENCEFIPFDPKPKQFVLSEEDQALLSMYPTPHPGQCIITQSVMEPKITLQNYSMRLHELLYIEEMAQYQQLSSFNISANLQVIDRYLILMPTNSTAKYSTNGELYAQLKLESQLSEDTAPGRLILTNCNSVLISLEKKKKIKEDSVKCKVKVYETLIEDRTKDVIYLRFSKNCVNDLKLVPDSHVFVKVQFQLNRIPICEMHLAVDKISSDASFIFPKIEKSPKIPWNPNKQWNDSLHEKLNPKQKEAVVAMTCSKEVILPPILLIGPFGTGKTFTLAQAIKQIVTQPASKVLVCTHSNSAADLYIKDYLHAFYNEHPEAKPLRVFYKNRRVQTVDPLVLKYAILNVNEDLGISSFGMPTTDDVMNHRIIVTTLSTARYLTSLSLPKGIFTHILIDEAAQALECELIMPLTLADKATKIVLAGDHMQLSPEVFSQFCRDKKFSMSLLERLYDHYPLNFSCRILLCENYRSHDAIIKYTSELFYDNKLIASGKQKPHNKFYPLTFFTARGEDTIDKNSTAFFNNSEVHELVERVCELLETWPEAWGPKKNESIGVVSPYYDQVVKIRTELRKRRLHGVSVERVLNVQGKQFRAIFLSTVRTRYTCHASNSSDVKEDEVDYGFLSNAKLLNTAITRAQSLVAVVGDPITLCTIGKCRKLWERFLRMCEENGSLHGISWNSLHSHLDGVEFRRSSYVLNPLAPEFIPSRYRQEEPYLYFPYPYYNLPYQQMVLMPTAANLYNNVPQASSYPLMYQPYNVQMMQYSNAHRLPHFTPGMRFVHPPYMPIMGSQLYHPSQLVNMPGYHVPRFHSPPLSNQKVYSKPSISGPVHGVPNYHKVNQLSPRAPISPSHSPSNSTPHSPKAMLNNHQTKAKAKSLKSKSDEQVCFELEHCFQLIRNFIPADCNLELLLKNHSMQVSWLNYVQKFKGAQQLSEFKKMLKLISHLKSEGHTYPPYVGVKPCNVCKFDKYKPIPATEYIPFKIPVPPVPLTSNTTSPNSDKHSYRNVLVNGSKQPLVEQRFKNSLRTSRSAQDIPKAITVNELEASFMKQDLSKESSKSVSRQGINDFCSMDVVNQVLNDISDNDKPAELDCTDFTQHHLSDSRFFRLRQKANWSEDRRSSWTPNLGMPKNFNSDKRFSFNLSSTSSTSSDDNPMKWSFTNHNSSHLVEPVKKLENNAPKHQHNSKSSGNIQFTANKRRDDKLSPSQNRETDESSKQLTYAGVVRSALQTHRDDSPSRNPLDIVQDLKGNTGYYNYFS